MGKYRECKEVHERFIEREIKIKNLHTVCRPKYVINMRNKKIVSAVGAIALTLGIGMNLQYSLDDYGIKTNTLSNFVWVQSVSSGGTSGTSKPEAKLNKSVPVEVECTIVTETTTSGGASGMLPGMIIGDVSASVSGGTSSSTTTTTTEKFKANRIMCYPGGAPNETCTPFNPCKSKQ